ncbi:hypothetical protein W97_09063 [Coniosporium apollinis CBS 100218]|uniref:Uncharacterized protein n=1 Tax=Coniosporium apollinis (strain CBS 100218) TaxID=1168221 RepID=R7Z6H9_CONA1|nr:uncharacterized protein W97_09063 [Coniosporium apollinis CBS 100218]EON69800.1 hypothetical protein W97_09063 [Coniosporium apollinis CBS 100218]
MALQLTAPTKDWSMLFQPEDQDRPAPNSLNTSSLESLQQQVRALQAELKDERVIRERAVKEAHASRERAAAEVQALQTALNEAVKQANGLGRPLDLLYENLRAYIKQGDEALKDGGLDSLSRHVKIWIDQFEKIVEQ